jgi:hypothetical protein
MVHICQKSDVPRTSVHHTIYHRQRVAAGKQGVRAVLAGGQWLYQDCPSQGCHRLGGEDKVIYRHIVLAVSGNAFKALTIESVECTATRLFRDRDNHRDAVSELLFSAWHGNNASLAAFHISRKEVKSDEPELRLLHGYDKLLNLAKVGHCLLEWPPRFDSDETVGRSCSRTL